MEDIVIEIIGLILEPLLEALFEFLAAVLADVILRFLGEVFEPPEMQNSLRTIVGHAVFGLAVGGLSLVIFPYHLVHPSKIHGASLIISPIITGALLSWVGALLRKRDKKAIQIESFSYGFVFAFGIALVRFLFQNERDRGSLLLSPSVHLVNRKISSAIFTASTAAFTSCTRTTCAPFRTEAVAAATEPLRR